jgi:hypothetical protein
MGMDRCSVNDGVSMARLRQRRYGRRYRVRNALAMAVVFPSLMGCYRYVPVAQPAVGTRTEVSLGITDQGRVALASQLGPGVRALRGRLTQATDSAFVVSLTAIEYIGAPAAARWMGEIVTVPRAYVSEIAERRLSRSRSWLTAGVFAALAAGVSTIAIVGLGGGDPGDNRPPGGGGDQ